MSLTTGLPKSRYEVEREIGISNEGNSAEKPLLLRLIEQVKYGVAPTTAVKQPVNNINAFTTPFDNEGSNGSLVNNNPTPAVEKKSKKPTEKGGKKGNKKVNKAADTKPEPK
jgi:hypothetical protein